MPTLADHRSSAGREWALIVVFLVMIAAPPVGQFLGFTDTDFIKKMEFRNPSPAPQWPAAPEDLKRLPLRTEHFVNDHFGFRSQLSTINSWVLTGLGSSGSDRVLVGRSGFLFLNNPSHVEELRGAARVEGAGLEQWIEAMTERCRWLEQRGIGMAVAIVPAKQTVYPEYLPKWVAPIGPSRLDDLMRQLRHSGELVVVDTRSALFAAKSTAPSGVYYQTDTHWNAVGAYSAYLQIMDALKHEYPSLEVVTPDQVEMIPDSRESPGGLKRMLNVPWAADEPLGPSARIKFPSRIRSREDYDGTRWVQQPPRQSRDDMTRASIDHTALDDAPRALILRDSFTTALRPFLSESFRDVLYVHHQKNTLDADLVDFFQPDVVLHIFVETSLYHLPEFRSHDEPFDLSDELE